MGGETLKIDTRHVLAVGDMSDEVTAMLGDLGYQPVLIRDPEFGRDVQSFREGHEWHMRFEYTATKQVRIDVRVQTRAGTTWLHFYEPDSETLSPASKALLQKLEDRAVLEFGPTNVSR